VLLIYKNIFQKQAIM